MSAPEFVEQIAKIETTRLGYEDHGIFTASLTLDYGGGSQGAGNYGLDTFDEPSGKRVGTAAGLDFIIGILSACGVQHWEDVRGSTLIALREQGYHGRIVGLKPLPTEKGETFMFTDWADQQRGCES